MKKNFEIRRENVEYQITARRYFATEFILKALQFLAGVFLSWLLFNKCLFNLNCNPIVVVFLAILALSCFQAAGFPIDKLANIKIT